MYDNDRNKLKIGDILYLVGSLTAIKIISDEDSSKPEIKVIFASKYSKYKMGDIVHISRNCLYPRLNKRYKKLPEEYMNKFYDLIKYHETITVDIPIKVIEENQSHI